MTACCRHAGLPTATYLQLRNDCKARSESRAALATRVATKGGSLYGNEEKVVTTAVDACKRVGWDGSDRRANKATDKATRALGLCSSPYPLRVVESEKDVVDTLVIPLEVRGSSTPGWFLSRRGV